MLSFLYNLLLEFDSTKELFKVLGGIGQHSVIAFEIKVLKEIGKLLQFYLSWIDTFPSDLNIIFDLLQGRWFYWAVRYSHFMELRQWQWIYLRSNDKNTLRITFKKQSPFFRVDFNYFSNNSNTFAPSLQVREQLTCVQVWFHTANY